MTLEEAKQLCPGDRVFIEAKVEKDETGRTIFNGRLFVSYDRGIGMEKVCVLANPYGVRKEAK